MSMIECFNCHLQANNAYIFPGFGLGLVISGAIRVHEDMLLAACEYLVPITSLSVLVPRFSINKE